ncbi:MAG: putative anti-sigma-YlaC factor YlaD, partial [Candidatus Krumholzibacteriia bacterium]
MRCNRSQEYVSQQLDGVLPPDMASKLRDHLDSCSECEEYRSDMLLGQRLLAATEPELPENFEWKLQLKLKQTLQQAAGEAQYPWTEKMADRWSWWRNFGAATAVGLAAVLALAMVIGPSNTGSIADIPGSRLAS